MTSLHEILKPAFAKLGALDIDKAILMIGDSGCGKSTLMAAALHGADSLDWKQVQVGSSNSYKSALDYKD